MIEIPHRYTGTVVYRSETATTLRDAVIEAVRMGANLTRADLTGADLSYANLTRAEGALDLPVGDPRGYRCVAGIAHKPLLVFAGCRSLTIAQAREHWGRAYEGDREIGDRYLRALDWLEARLTPSKRPAKKSAKKRARKPAATWRPS